MIAETMEDESGIKFNGNYISNLRYADDAALVSESTKKLQKMLDKLNSTCLDYGMAINVKKTKVMVISKASKVKSLKCSITLNNMALEQVNRYKYLGSWITEDARRVKGKNRDGQGRMDWSQNIW